MSILVLYMLGDLCEKVFEILIGLEAVCLRRFNYAINDSARLCAFHGINHVPVGAPNAERTDRTLTRRVVDRDLTVVKEYFQVPFLVDAVIETIFGLLAYNRILVNLFCPCEVRLRQRL